MKKSLLVTVLTAFFLLPVFSFEWGGLFTENAKGTIGDFSYFDTLSVRQSNSLCLWASVPFDEASNWYFAGQASYKYNLDFSILGKTLTNIVDFDLVKISGVIPAGVNNITFSAGRFFVGDTTGKIFVQNCDGLLLNYNSLFTKMTLYAGYTGLLNGYNVYMLNPNGEVDSKNSVLLKVYRQSPSYIPAIASVTFPSLFLNQSVGVQAIAILDVNGNSDSKANRYYGTLNMAGPISGPIYYSLNTTFGSKDFKNVSNYSSLKLSYLNKTLTVKVGAEYASGNQAFLEPFVGFTSQAMLNSATAPEYSSMLLPGLDVIFSIKNLSFYFNGKVAVACPENSFSLQGVDASLKGYLNIFSDLRFDFGATMYYDIMKHGSENFYTANLGLTLSF